MEEKVSRGSEIQVRTMHNIKKIVREKKIKYDGVKKSDASWPAVARNERAGQ